VDVGVTPTARRSNRLSRGDTAATSVSSAGDNMSAATQPTRKLRRWNWPTEARARRKKNVAGIAVQLRAAVAENGISERNLARSLGVPTAKVAAYLSGTASPQTRTRFAIAEALGHPHDAFEASKPARVPAPRPEGSRDTSPKPNGATKEDASETPPTVTKPGAVLLLELGVSGRARVTVDADLPAEIALQIASLVHAATSGKTSA
jgi:transcriptional regulator with XRE-family HTH domain